MKTPKETFSGGESFKKPNGIGNGRGHGVEQMMRDQIAQQVADLIGKI